MNGESDILRPILLVDDNEDDRFFAMRRIKQAGIRNPISSASCGEEAVEYLRRARLSDGKRTLPCVVFLDIKMPDLTGHEVLAWAKQQSDLTSVRFVMLSGSNEPEDVARATALGADGYVLKHPDFTVFAEIVARYSSPAAGLTLLNR